MKNNNTLPVTKSSRRPLSENQNSALPGGGAKDFEALYLKKDYKAAAQYLLNNKQQLESGIFHYNLGTVYSKMGDNAAARYHLEKAIKEGYVNSASLNNLAFVKNQLQVDDISTSTSIADKFIDISLSVPLPAYWTLTLGFLLGVLVLMRFKKITSRALLVLTIFLSFLPVLYSYFYVDRVNYAVALKEVPLYEGPSRIFNEKGKIRAGSKVILGEFKDGWFFVKFPISLAGWVSKDQLGLY